MSTIKDVARLAGVGVATASRALSGKGSVSEDTAECVRSAAARLHYQPSSIARALSLQRSNAIGLYVPNFDLSFYSALVTSVDSVLRSVGRHMVAANGCGNHSLRQQAQDGLDFLLARDCDGLVVACHSLHDDDLNHVISRCPNTVVVNRRLAGHADQCFTADHHLGGRLAAQALLSRSHRRIATIRGPEDAPDSIARLAGFTEELARQGVVVRREHDAGGSFDLASGAAAAQRLLDAPRGAEGRLGFTAVFAANDLMAMTAISRFTQAGLHVPLDVSVIGYDDADFAAYTAPPLTTVQIPIADVTANACRHVLNLCYGLDLPVARDFPPRVVWRQSVGEAPQRTWNTT